MKIIIKTINHDLLNINIDSNSTLEELKTKIENTFNYQKINIIYKNQILNTNQKLEELDIKDGSKIFIVCGDITNNVPIREQQNNSSDYLDKIVPELTHDILDLIVKDKTKLEEIAKSTPVYTKYEDLDELLKSDDFHKIMATIFSNIRDIVRTTNLTINTELDNFVRMCNSMGINIPRDQILDYYYRSGCNTQIALSLMLDNL